MATGAKRHVMPANSIGYFSPEESGRRRRRVICCKRRQGDVSFSDKAENVGWLRRIYGAGKGTWLDHDSFFMPFEAMNSDALTPLVTQREMRKDADVWVRLAAYVSSRLTRDPQLELETADRIVEWKMSATVGYPLNMMRLSAAVLRTRWEILVSPDHEFILNDRGYAAFTHENWEAHALVVPLRRRAAVIIGGGRRHPKQIVWDNGRWEIEIPTFPVAGVVAQSLNAVLWNAARAEAYGSTHEVLDLAEKQASGHPPAAQDFAGSRDHLLPILGSTPDENRQDENLLHLLLPGIRVPTTGDSRYLVV